MDFLVATASLLSRKSSHHFRCLARKSVSSLQCCVQAILTAPCSSAISSKAHTRSDRLFNIPARFSSDNNGGLLLLFVFDDSPSQLDRVSGGFLDLMKDVRIPLVRRLVSHVGSAHMVWRRAETDEECRNSNTSKDERGEELC
jgi:hypothetical protein